jgi:hypothetical protein
MSFTSIFVFICSQFVLCNIIFLCDFENLDIKRPQCLVEWHKVEWKSTIVSCRETIVSYFEFNLPRVLFSCGFNLLIFTSICSMNFFKVYLFFGILLKCISINTKGVSSQQNTSGKIVFFSCRIFQFDVIYIFFFFMPSSSNSKYLIYI